jgi:hypothetical protein
MSDGTREDEPAPRPDVPRYADEPRFPRVLVAAWIVFGFWALHYIVEKLIPAWQAWSRSL